VVVVSSTNNIRRAPLRVSTTNEINQENDNLIDVDLNCNIDEPSAKDISEANKELVGPTRVKSIQANHFGKYMIWCRSIIWKVVELGQCYAYMTFIYYLQYYPIHVLTYVCSFTGVVLLSFIIIMSSSKET
jgi:hypothetical protein